MVKSWQVSWNKSIYDYIGIINSYKKNDTDIIYQSKGLAIMKNLPKIDDNVYVSCNKLKIMKCKIISNFIEGVDEKNDVHNEGSSRTHTSNNTYLKMKIIKIYDNPTELIGRQRTWITYKGE
tara:strand:+ start:806 stop:1171 length:366 start_codon:yes stop_codon:yes gene_type:complete